MSVINKMLRDLDSRGGLGPRKLEEGIRDVQRVPAENDEPRPWGKITAIVVVVVLMAFVAWYLMAPSPKPQVAAQKSQAAVAPPKTASPVAGTAPAATTPAATTPAAAAPATALTAAATIVPPAQPAPAAGEPPRPLPTPTAGAAALAPSKPLEVSAQSLPSSAIEAPAIATAAVKSQQAAVASQQAAVDATPVGKSTSVPAKVATVTAALPKPEPAAKRAEPPTKKAEPATKAAEPPAPPPETAARKAEIAVTKAAPVTSKTDAARAESAPGQGSESPPVNISVDRGQKALTGTARAAAEYRRGNDLLTQSRVDGALAAYAEAVKADPRHVPARQAMVVVLLEQGRGSEATTALQEGIEAVPQNTAWPMLLARLQVDAQDLKGATTTLERSLTAGGADPDYRAFLATVLQMQSRHVEAIQHYQAALQMAPDSGRSLTGLAISLEAEKRLPEARDAYRKAIATNTLGRDLEAFAQGRLKQIQ